MATTNNRRIRTPTYQFLPNSTNNNVSVTVTESSVFEFDESELYNSSTSLNESEFRKTIHTSRFHATKSSSGRDPSSLPINVPDWSKILGDEYRQNRIRNYDDGYDDDEGDDEMVPPHEFLARKRIASFSVHEGVGRTLKGRDLSRVRNAIWAKTGFQD
ncbi:unnamed protein product [Trifolium pratense]|uniref:Uncharacterized protein n=1 Tax=Trifolium pratense TaxID=57577 RepID=A0ACB0KU37_TRIPR|nr:unnamed protein product [Trifolium pratense]